MSRSANPDRIFLTAAELGQRWGKAEWTIQQAARTGKLPFATRLLGSWRFPLDKVEQYESKQAVGK